MIRYQPMGSACLGIAIASLLLTTVAEAHADSGLAGTVTPAEPPADLPTTILRPVGWPPALAAGNWNAEDEATARQQLLTATAHSVAYLNTSEAAAAYEDYPVKGVTRIRVLRSVLRFRSLLLTADSLAAFNRAVQQEFELYQTVGYDGAGTVHFTGYFEPSYTASRVRTEEFRYPLYRRPADLDDWALPHPTRVELEGKDGLVSDRGPLQGLELVWMRDRLEAFLVQVQGSARLQLTDGTTMSVGYAGRTDYDYVSIGRELIKDGRVSAEGMSLQRLLDFFAANPAALDDYLPRNDRFVFFRETAGGPPTGTFSFPVTAGYSIAMDKSLMPPGAIALINLDWPMQTTSGDWQTQQANRYVLNQDTGGAILGPGRADIFIGTGDAAGEQAGRVNTDGSLYFLLLKD
ncbi:MAG: murein transglycosylase A [Leptolyngbyaceae cyanobacterium]